MKTRDWFWAAAAVGGMAGTVVVTQMLRAYRRDQQRAGAELAGLSQMVETAVGPMEYAEEGAGPAVIISHGSGGGFDQGLHCVRLLGRPGLRFIATSRFGYLGSPMPANPTPQAQADAYAALLDSLGLRQAAIMGFSAGGMSAVQFALRHSERCWGLVLVSGISRAVKVSTPAAQTLGEAMLSSDFAFWALSTYLMRLMLSSTGFSAAEEAGLVADPEARRAMYAMLRFDPVTRRRRGMLNDIAQAARFPSGLLARVAVPTLVIHGTADPLVPFHVGALAANTIPGARLVILENAGHLGWFTRSAETRPATIEFLAGHAPGLQQGTGRE